MDRGSKEDRKILIALLVLVLLFMGYLYFNTTKSRANQEGEGEALRSDVLTENADTTALASGQGNAARETLIAVSASPAEPKSQSQDTLPPIRSERYPGPPPRTQYPSKLKEGCTIDLNSADTLLLLRVPGIGPSFARRIYKYRELLGGYYVVEQLQEVYGMERERYLQIASFMEVKTPPQPITLSRDTISRHPYLQWRHKRVLQDLIRSGRHFSWKELMESGQFSRDDSLRLAPYLTLE